MTARVAGRVGAVAAALRAVVLRFLLPLIGLGLVLWGVEAGMEALGFHQDVVKMLRIAVIPLYLLIAMLATRKQG